MDSTQRRREFFAGAVVALATLLPFLPGILAGRALYFRDLSLYFFPLRRFIAEGLGAGQLRWWNPYIHEGEPLTLPALGYPLDLLHALWPDERLFSLLLALHLPLGALGLRALARALGAGRMGAALAGLVYGLGGFAASSVNLYVYAQALGWAPLAVLGLLRAAEGGWGARRRLALGALPVGLCFSTTGLELALQALLVASALVPRARRLAPLAACAGLGVALAGLPLLVVSGTVAGSARARGFTTDVVLAHSIHPLTFVQTAVASWHGDAGRLAERWWGQNFFPRGFPYVLSLYLGAAVLALALVGCIRGRPPARRLGLLALVAIVMCLGRWIGWGAVLEHLPALRVVRYPAKAFYTVHLAVALLAGLGLDALARSPRARDWTGLAWAAGGAGGLLLAFPLLPSAAPTLARWFAAGFFPPDMAWAERWADLHQVLADAAVGGAAAVAVALVAALAARGRLRPPVAALAVAALVAADLVRASAGINPTVPPAALRPAAETAALADALRAGGARVFTCDVLTSPAYVAARAGYGGGHPVWTLWTLTDTLTPARNLLLRVPSAYSTDLTMLVPEQRVLGTGEGCARMGALTPRLRAAAVTHVLTVDALPHPELIPLGVSAPGRIAPLAVRVYALAAPRPRVEVAAHAPPASAGTVSVVSDAPGHVALTADVPAAADVLLRDAYAPGWSARVNGQVVELRLAEGRYREVAVPAGRSTITMDYRPPRLALGAALSAAAALILAALCWRTSGAAARAAPP